MKLVVLAIISLIALAPPPIDFERETFRTKDGKEFVAEWDGHSLTLHPIAGGSDEPEKIEWSDDVIDVFINLNIFLNFGFGALWQNRNFPLISQRNRLFLLAMTDQIEGSFEDKLNETVKTYLLPALGAIQRLLSNQGLARPSDLNLVFREFGSRIFQIESYGVTKEDK